MGSRVLSACLAAERLKWVIKESRQVPFYKKVVKTSLRENMRLDSL